MKRALFLVFLLLAACSSKQGTLEIPELPGGDLSGKGRTPPPVVDGDIVPTPPSQPSILAVKVIAKDVQDNVIFNDVALIDQSPVPVISVPYDTKKLSLSITSLDPAPLSLKYDLNEGPTSLIQDTSDNVLEVSSLQFLPGSIFNFKLSAKDSTLADWSWSRDIPVKISGSGGGPPPPPPPPTTNLPPEVAEVKLAVLDSNNQPIASPVVVDIRPNTNLNGTTPPIAVNSAFPVKLNFVFRAKASDPDGPSLTYTLNANGMAASVQNSTGTLNSDTIPLSSATTINFKLVIDDNQGASWSRTIPVQVGTPPPPPPPPPPPALLAEVHWVYVRKAVKCFVQTTRAVPASILQSPPAANASPVACESESQAVVISVNVPPRDHPVRSPAFPGNTMRTPLSKVSDEVDEPTSRARPTVIEVPETGVGEVYEVDAVGKANVPSQPEVPVTTMPAGISTDMTVAPDAAVEVAPLPSVPDFVPSPFVVVVTPSDVSETTTSRVLDDTFECASVVAYVSV